MHLTRDWRDRTRRHEAPTCSQSQSDGSVYGSKTKCPDGGSHVSSASRLFGYGLLGMNFDEESGLSMGGLKLAVELIWGSEVQRRS